MIIIDYKIVFIIFFVSIFLNYFIYKQNFLPKNTSATQIQDIHIGNPSRLGGLAIYLVLSGYIFFGEINLKLMLSCSLIFMVPAFLEDLRVFINPLVRLVAIIMSCFILVMSFPNLPQFDFGFWNIVFNHKIFQIIFFTLALATVINGQNIIDGTNGLSGFTALSIFASILLLGFYCNDLKTINISAAIIATLIAFLFFNYPFGKLFLGDGGSYFLGLLGGYIIIDIFSRNPMLPAWSAVSILIYPTLEVIFSYFRKIIQGKSPFMPDNLHLHLKIFYLISNNNKKSKLFNALVAPFLGIIWLSPLALLPFSLQYPHWSIIITMILVAVYLFFYYSIPNPTKK